MDDKAVGCLKIYLQTADAPSGKLKFFTFFAFSEKCCFQAKKHDPCKKDFEKFVKKVFRISEKAGYSKKTL